MSTNLGIKNDAPYYNDEEPLDSHGVVVRDGQPWLIPVEELPETTIAVDLYRSVDGGGTWEMVQEGLPAQLSVVTDAEGLSFGDTLYRAVAFAANGSSSQVETTAPAESQAMWLGGGAEFEVIARLPFDPAVKVTTGRARSVQRYEGRARPVAYAGAQLSRVVDFGGTVLQNDPDNASIERMEEIAELDTAVHLYRDPDGRRIYGQISDLGLSRTAASSDGGVWGFTVQIEETDR